MHFYFNQMADITFKFHGHFVFFFPVIIAEGNGEIYPYLGGYKNQYILLLYFIVIILYILLFFNCSFRFENYCEMSSCLL